MIPTPNIGDRVKFQHNGNRYGYVIAIDDSGMAIIRFGVNNDEDGVTFPYPVHVERLTVVDGRGEPVNVAPKPGDFLAYTMVTDTQVYEVVAVTDRTIRIRQTDDGQRTWNDENVDPNPFPVTLTEQVPSDSNPVRTVRLRKDGTYRVGNGLAPLRPAPTMDGAPVRRTDYRF